MVANIYALLAAALVLGVTRSDVWAFPALTKISPACVGAVWFAVRGEWSKLWRAGALMAGLSIGSFAFEPHLWREWAQLLLENAGNGGVEYQLRVVAALAITVHAARRGPIWLLGVAFYLAMPLAGWGQTQTPLVAIVRLVAGQRTRSLRDTSAAGSRTAAVPPR